MNVINRYKVLYFCVCFISKYQADTCIVCKYLNLNTDLAKNGEQWDSKYIRLRDSDAVIFHKFSVLRDEDNVMKIMRNNNDT